jgi:hypothetical protein
VNGLPTRDAIILKGRGGVALLFIIDTHTAHLTRKPNLESTESQSESVDGRARKSALEELIEVAFVIVASDPPCSSRDGGAAFIVILSAPSCSPRDGGAAFVVIASTPLFR